MSPSPLAVVPEPDTRPGSPAGLNVTNDEELRTLLRDLEAWRANLPDDLQFRGPDTPQNAGTVPPFHGRSSSPLTTLTGLLFLLYTTVNMIFWRVFMRISYTCPAHLKFALTVEKWSALNNLTRDAINWLDRNERAYDVWLLVAYCATSCALVQVCRGS